ncbi:MAG: hypothetical protein Q8M17_04245 [Actinomycetota bacterium]|nr:hypothetical protein [Actinomycetota bacterium]
MTAPTPFAGLRREFEVGLRLAPTATSALAAAKALAAILDSAAVAARLAGIGTGAGRVHLTIAVTLGSIDEVKTAAEPTRRALALIQCVVDELGAYDPALVLLPDEASPEARLAAAVQDRRCGLGDVVGRLAGTA